MLNNTGCDELTKTDNSSCLIMLFYYHYVVASFLDRRVVWFLHVPKLKICHWSTTLAYRTEFLFKNPFLPASRVHATCCYGL